MEFSRTEDLRLDCQYCPVRHRAICAASDDAEFSKLNAIKSYKSIPAGQAIVLRGERLDVVASIVSGVAILSNTTVDGRMQITGMLLPSDFIGRPGRDSCDHDITAVTDLTLCCFRRRPFEDLIEDAPAIRKRLLDMTFDELDAARHWMLLLGRLTAREKIVSFLMLVVHRSTLPEDVDEPVQIDLPLSREAMASYLGLTIETVSRQISKLRREGLIELKTARRVVIPSASRLVAELENVD